MANQNEMRHASLGTLLDVILQRNRFEEKVMVDEDTLVIYIKDHPRKESVLSRMIDSLNRTNPELLNINNEIEEVQRFYATQFIKAYDSNLIEVSNIFTEVNPPLTICEHEMLLEWWHKKRMRLLKKVILKESKKMKRNLEMIIQL